MTDGKKMSGFLPFSRPAMGVEELAAVKEVLESGWITTGPKNQALEQAFCQLTGNQHAIAVSSATAGMHITLMALEIGKGDEVITPSLTWVSTLNMISLLGATPVMVDVDRDTLMVTPEAIEAAITPRTKAIIPVHYAGAPADIDAIRAIGERYGIAVIEDAAHAVGTYYKGRHIGAKGTAIFSFHAIKNITCAEGGLIVTDNENLARQLRMLKFHGLGVDAYDRHTWGRAPQDAVAADGGGNGMDGLVLSDDVLLQPVLELTQLGIFLRANFTGGNFRPKLDDARKVLHGQDGRGHCDI